MSLFNAFKRTNGREPGLQGGGNGYYHNLFPKRQLFVPRYEYPLWDHDWEKCGRQRRDVRQIKDNGCQRLVTRQIFLVRHGQYREDLPTDEQQELTEMGRKQAKKTGGFLAEIVKKNNTSTRDCATRLMSCSTMKRARETADIIHGEIENMRERHNKEIVEGLEDPNDGGNDGANNSNNKRGGGKEMWEPLERDEPDPLLQEARPCHYIPSTEPISKDVVNAVDKDNARCEEAFRKYIGHSRWLEERENYRCVPAEKAQQECPGIEREHEYQIIVAHANIIRYLVCRALQLPPEAWLRFSLFNGSVTYLVVHANGGVSLRFFGEIGHMGYDLVSHDLYEGFNWDSYEFYAAAIQRKERNNKEEEL